MYIPLFMLALGRRCTVHADLIFDIDYDLLKEAKKKIHVTFKQFALRVEDMFRSVTVTVTQPACVPVFHVTHMNMYASLFFLNPQPSGCR